MTRARTQKLALALCGVAAAFLGFVGAAHTPWGRPMLGWLQGAPGCPIGDELDPAVAAAVRAQLTAPLAGEAAGAASEVLRGLLPGEDSRADAQRWSVNNELRCTPSAALLQDRCEGELLGHPGARVMLQYDDARLLDVEVSFRSADADAAFAMARSLEAELGRGTAAWHTQGAMDADALATGPLSQTRREYRFTNLRTEVRATNLGPRGYLVRGFAQSLPGEGANTRSAR